MSRPDRREHLAALEERGDLDSEPGSRPWAIALRLLMHAAIKDERSKAEHLRRLMALLKEHRGFAALSDEDGKPFATFEAFCRAPQPFGLGYDAEVIERIIEERRSAQARAAEAEPAMSRAEAGAKGGRGKKANDNVKSFRGGNDPDYLTSVIARDHPDVLDRMKAGEFRSVRQAALEAGIVKARRSVPADPVALGRWIASHYSHDEIEALVDALLTAARKAS